MGNYSDLKVSHKANAFTLAVYHATATFPQDELYGLTSQMRRCSASIPANIAEGCGRGTDPELVRFLRIALGSATELEQHLLLAHNLGFIDDLGYEDIVAKSQEIQRMLAALIRSLMPKSTQRARTKD
jgi:four helix bundle protein